MQALVISASAGGIDSAPAADDVRVLAFTNLIMRALHVLAGLTAFALIPPAAAQTAGPVDPRLLTAMTWRNLGPFRAGRTAAVSGAIGEPGTFYMGTPAAGVCKTTSAGETWYPVFDSVKEISSIGSVEVAPSNANVVYVGAGDIITGGGINEGNGVYKSVDAGRTWRHLGLDATKQIPTMLVDPSNPDVVLVGAQGDVHVKSRSRGVFRSTDGGATWTQTLFVDDSTGLQKLARAFDTPNVIFATTVAHYTPAPVLNAPPRQNAPNGPTSTKLFKSTDGGVTWKEITGGGLPARLTGKMWVAVANTTRAQRVYVIGDWGLYRSDDGGSTWTRMAADDDRIRNGQGGYNCGVYVDPQNPDVVYTLNTSSYKSIDGGRTFTGFRGAPGGDDPQQLWIDPTNGRRMLFGFDQGSIVTLDGGATWSSWYNQSTEQIYHLSVDNSFPYYVYGTQQDAGAIRTRVRGNLGAITPLDWDPVSGWEWGTITPDPLDNNTVYASGSGILKISYPSEQWINVSPAQDATLKLRTTSSQPVIFAPWNKHMILAAFQSVWSSLDGGMHWTAISGDLAARSDAPTAPATPGGPAPQPTGAIESMRASTVMPGMIWVGTGTGLIKVTRNSGKTWEDASIPGLPFPPRAEVLAVEPSNFDAATAYAVVDQHRVGDYAPHVFRTHDFGKTWTKITNGLATGEPSGSFVRVVRNDVKRKGLLFAGTESGMYVSFNDGDNWQPLMGGLPNTSYRDAVIKDNDLVVSTYGRGFFALDDISALRQMSAGTAGEPAHLFAPGAAFRVRRNVGADTPFPAEVPHALNPLDGAIIDYWLGASPASDITLDVFDASGARVRHMSSAPILPVSEAARPPHPNFWVATPMPLTRTVGANRTNWDLRYDTPRTFTHTFEINANPGLTPPSPEGPLVAPGTYTLKLTVDGRTSSQTVTVRNDPRSPASTAAITAQVALQKKLVAAINFSYDAQRAAATFGDALRGDTTPNVVTFLARLDSVGALDAQRRSGRGAGQAPPPNFRALNGSFVGMLNTQESGDAAPGAAVLAAFASRCKELHDVTLLWQRLNASDLPAINAILRQRGKAVLVTPAGTTEPPSC